MVGWCSRDCHRRRPALAFLWLSDRTPDQAEVRGLAGDQCEAVVSGEGGCGWCQVEVVEFQRGVPQAQHGGAVRVVLIGPEHDNRPSRLGC